MESGINLAITMLGVMLIEYLLCKAFIEGKENRNRTVVVISAVAMVTVMLLFLFGEVLYV
jgi:hypothetical protein